MWDVRFNENDADDPKDMALEVDIGNRSGFVFEKTVGLTASVVRVAYESLKIFNSITIN